MAMIGRGTAWTVIAALTAVALSGCASEDTTGRFLVTPDKFVLYNCAQLSDATQANFARQQVLEKLIAKAGTGGGAEFVSDLAYRPEYVQLRGEMNELRKANAEKNCKPIINTGSPTGRASDQAVP
ncbi:MAG TPA: hypothetical protein VHQ92_00750 [Pseudolabrys sp.]|jgi:hypothetical protein|nr:hypothetical protein [Pseudolabrys sp.]